MSSINFFTGEYSHTIDTKGRVIIPAKLRDLLGDEFIVTKGLDPCLFVFPVNEWLVIDQKLRALPLNNESARKFMRFMSSGATICELDKQGRILLTQKQREYAHLDKDVMVIGNTNRVEIWDMAIWTENNTYDDVNDILKDMADCGMTL